MIYRRRDYDGFVFFFYGIIYLERRTNIDILKQYLINVLFYVLGDDFMFYNPQANIDRINAQIAELEKLKSQVPNIQPITQNFQLAPQNAFRYANNIDDVQKEYVVCDTPFFSKDLSVLWVKNTNGEIRTFELNEVIQKDEKDLQIEFLQAQIDELKKGRYYEYNANTNESTKDEKPTTSKSDSTNDEQ